LAPPIKYAGIALPNPTTTATSNYQASQAITTPLVESLLLSATSSLFNLVGYQSAIANAKADIKRDRHSVLTSAFDDIRARYDAHPVLQRRLDRAIATGTWLNQSPLASLNTALSAQAFRDNLCDRYGLEPFDLPTICDGCGQPTCLQHAKCCKKGGLILLRHNDLRDELADIARIACSPSCIRSEPEIYPSLTTSNISTHPNSIVPTDPHLGSNARGDLYIHGFFDRGIGCIIDIRVVSLDAPSHISTDSHKVLQQNEIAKKAKYLDACLQQRKHFAPFVISTDGLLGTEAKQILQRLANRLADKWSQPYSVTRAYVNSRISFACCRTTHLCIRGSRIPISHTSSFPYFPSDSDPVGTDGYTDDEGTFHLFRDHK
jgi:hypothetical protein